MGEHNSLSTMKIFTVLICSVAMHFTTTSVPLHTNFTDELVCLMASSVWNERKELTCRPLNGIMFHVGQFHSCLGIYVQYVSCGWQLTVPLAICFQEDALYSV
jgi:hypothetical protein